MLPPKEMCSELYFLVKLSLLSRFSFQLLKYFSLRSNPNNVNEAIIVWGDTGGYVNALHFTSVNIALFERPPAPAGEKQGR